MKLFLKIFLWFLATIVLIVTVMTFVTRTFQTEPLYSRWQRSAQRTLTLYAGTIEQISKYNDPNALTELLDRLRDNSSIRDLVVIDDRGNVIFGDPSVVAEFTDIKEQAKTAEGAVIDPTSETPFGAVKINFADGRHGMLLARWEQQRAQGLFFDSWLGVLRLMGLLLTASLLCYALAKYISSPIRKLRNATHQLAAGDLSVRVAENVGKRRDELSDLARDFDNMAERIESLIKTQQRLNSDISHELRSPLARLNVALEIAKQKSNVETAPMLGRIEDESNRLNEMIGRLLVLAKLESGAADFEPSLVDLTELVKGVTEDAAFEAEAKGKKVNLSSTEKCLLMGSENLLRSAVENVLRNAVKYTADDTVVDVSLVRSDDLAVIRIQDHGGGVPEGELDKLFRPFYRVGEARERRTGGIGLGLAIAHRAVEAHKGTIRAINNNGGLMVEMKFDLNEGLKN